MLSDAEIREMRTIVALGNEFARRRDDFFRRAAEAREANLPGGNVAQLIWMGEAYSAALQTMGEYVREGVPT